MRMNFIRIYPGDKVTVVSPSSYARPDNLAQQGLNHRTQPGVESPG